MKIIYYLICIVTLGICNVYVEYPDGTKFEWVGWAKRIQDKLYNKK